MGVLSEDSKLINQYLMGDEKSLEVLISKYLKPIYIFIYKNIGSQPEAEDVTQEVFVKVWKNIRKFDQNKNFKPWIFQIAKNTSIDYLRKKKTIPFSRFENEKGQNVLVESIAAPPLNIIGKMSDERIIATAMRGLNHKEQIVINLRHTEGLSFNEIAKTLEESVNTVKSRYRRGLLNLKKNLQNGHV